ncbi:DNA primase [Microbaculum marinisediminis]|uniref:DNA primase n=1 Tax=Microbaculum marinisediminis TaxID=2931392 RepID=A0AAW5R3E8_9HYPH|nr:DNA primase [Microbaculum sp. A6E488]MCT8974775.1 DNA primase [Microbaculum sp. A6E488]
MKFPPSLLDEIRARLPVSDVVGRKVKLRRQGREFIGLSPFNAEKSPSFTVNDQKGFYHCFSSGKHGDIFRFLMETEGLSFPEAVERLAGEAGVPMPKPDRHAEQRERERAGLADVMEAAAAFFEASLRQPEGREARDYLVNRGLDDQTCKRFRIGYASGGRYALKEHLGKLGIANEAMAKAGLLITGSDIAVPFDRFRDRVIFPITDLRNRVIAFGGRALRSDQQPKYLNSPETELFHKGRVLFNMAAARRAAQEKATVIVAEGYMDVVALTRAGFGNSVAPLGTALTEDQLALLWRVADEPVLCFDGDAAGLRAAFRAADLAMPHLQAGKSLRFALLPEGSDPDDLVREAGAAALAEVIDRARPLADMLWTREVEATPLDTPERRAAFEKRLAETIGRIPDVRVRRHYGELFRDRLAEFFGRRADRDRGGRAGGWTGGGRHGNDRRGGGRAPWQRGADRAAAGASAGFSGQGGGGRASSDLVRRLASARQALPRREAILLLTLLNHPELLTERAEAVAHMELSHRDLDRLRGALLDIAAHHDCDPADARKRLVAKGHGDLVDRLESLWTGAGRAEWWVAPDTATVDAERAWDHTAALHHKLVTLHRELKAAEMALQAEPSDENLARLYDIQAQLANAEGTEALMDGFGQASGRPMRAF